MKKRLSVFLLFAFVIVLSACGAASDHTAATIADSANTSQQSTQPIPTATPIPEDGLKKMNTSMLSHERKV